MAIGKNSKGKQSPNRSMISMVFCFLFFLPFPIMLSQLVGWYLEVMTSRRFAEHIILTR
jgi:hypothetical protein